VWSALKTENKEFLCNGIQISSRRTGPSHPDVAFSLMFLHGRFSTQDSWSPLAEQLARHYISITFDLPGFGVSPCFGRTKFKLHDHLNLIKDILIYFEVWNRPLVLVGHDLGCAWMEWMAELYPSQVHATVYLNAFLREHPVSRLHAGIRSWRYRRWLHRLVKTAGSLNAHQLETIRQNWSIPAQRLSQTWILENLALEWEGEAHTESIESKRRRSHLPSLILWGMKDEMNSSEVGLKLFSQIPQASFFENENCSHWPQLENPAWVHDHLSSFLFELGKNISGDQKFLLR
jgi:pimeloyl-ACP methyl ester carboxylesterase